jgi:hypothetical protein
MMRAGLYAAIRHRHLSAAPHCFDQRPPTGKRAHRLANEIITVSGYGTKAHSISAGFVPDLELCENARNAISDSEDRGSCWSLFIPCEGTID